MKLFRYIVFVLLLSVGNFCFASASKVVQLTVDDGLINGNIHQIIQDREGFVWIATENGLVRYDGYDYKVFQTIPNNVHSISHNFVNSVNTNDGLRIWIGTMSGLDYYNPISGEFEHFHFYNAQGAVNMKPALRVLPAENGCYVQSDDRFVYFAQVGNDTIREISSKSIESSSFVSAMDLISEQQLVVGNKAGQLYVFQPNGETKLLKNSSSAVSVVKNIGDKRFCVCYANGEVDIYNNEEIQYSYLLTDVNDTYINDIEQIGDSLLWLGTRAQGIYELQIGKGIYEVDLQNLINRKCLSVFKDSFGNIWIGHSYGGVTLRLAQACDFDESTFSCRNIENKKVLAIARVKDKMYVGTDGDGLFVYGKNGSVLKNYTYESGINGIPFGNAVTTLCADEEYVWIGTFNSGVFALSQKNDALAFQQQLSACPAKEVSSVFADSQRNIWIGTYANGVYVFNKDSAKFIRHYTGYEEDGFLNISCDGSTCFFEDSQKNVWIGSYYGISKISPTGLSRIYKYDDFPGMRSSVVTSISQTADGKIWFGSLQGLGFYDNTNDSIIALYNSQTANRLAVCGVVPQQDSSLILITPKNVYVYNQERNDFQLISTLKRGELKRNAFSVSNDNILLGTDNGMKELQLPILSGKDSIHILRLTDILVHGESIFSAKYGYEISCENGVYYLQLPYNQKDISLKFSNFYFDENRPVDYTYKLKGLNDSWFLLHDENEVDYTNLSGGDYVFYVKQLSNSADSEIELHIHISKALWERTEFYVILVLLVISVICFVFIRRMQRMIRMRNILKKQVDLRMLDIKRKTEQIELQNVQMKLQRDAATRQRSESEMQRAGLEKRLSILLGKIQKNDDLISELKQRTVALNKDKLMLKRRVDLYENNVRDVLFKILLPSEKIEYVSPSVVDLTGYEASEFVDSEITLKDLLPPDIKMNIKQYRSILLEGKLPEVVDFKLITKDGAEKTVRQYSRYETNLKGTVIAAEILLSFISEDAPKMVVHKKKQDLVFDKTEIEDSPLSEYDWSAKKILVCDSDDESYAFVKECLFNTKIAIIRALDGEESVAKFMDKNNKFNAILLDIQLPKLNGFEVAQQIRKNNKKIPVIAQTLYGNYEAKLQCFDAGCDTYIAKPYKANDLQELLAKYLEK